MASLLFHSVAVSRSKDVPPFGPPIPKSVTFPKSAVFRDFLLAKVINGENAAHKSEKFRAMATRTRQEYLKDLAENFVSTTTIDNAVKFSFINLGAKKKEKVKPRKDAHLLSVGAVTWSVSTRDFSQSLDVDCLLGISNEFIVLIEEDSKNVVFNCSCRDVIGWTSGIMSIKIFYERGECVMLSAHDNCGEDIREIVQRLEVRVMSSTLSFSHRSVRWFLFFRCLTFAQRCVRTSFVKKAFTAASSFVSAAETTSLLALS